MNEEVHTKCGYAAVIGLPNVGKSTLLNGILGQKLSIVTSKPQTTRNRVLAVHNMGDSQIVFLDTPGMHRAKGSLGEYMNEAAEGAISESNVCVWILDAAYPGRGLGLTPAEQVIAEKLSGISSGIIALINKVDKVKEKDRLLPLMAAVSRISGVEEAIPISARTGNGVDLFLTTLEERLPVAPKLFPEDMLSDKAERFFVAELVREAVTELTRQEVPYSVAVVVEKFLEQTDSCLIHATIHVEKNSQKGIIVGKGGSMIREIGVNARMNAEKMLGCPVDLRLHVNVSTDWTKKPGGLKKMGYE